jgi:isopentenyl-diphosphate delta-isomerase
MQLSQTPLHLDLQLTETDSWPCAENNSDEVIIVDPNDVSIGTAPKLDAHRNGLRHRAISIVVGDQHRRVLLHRRAAGKYHSKGLWTNTCCSHPLPGECTIDAASRRLGEEMGIICPLTFIFSMNYRAEVSNGLIEDEIVHVFGGHFNGTPTPNSLEVSAWCWKPFTEVERDIDERPQIYTVWFRKIRHDFWSDVAAFLYDPLVEPKGRQPGHTALARL